MRFVPKTEEECSSAGLIPKGIYPFEVADAKDKVSKSGNDMIEMRLEVYGEDDRKHGVFEYLVDSEGSAFKIRGFAEAVGMLKQYEQGELRSEDLIGRTGTAKIDIKKDPNGQYADKNVVREYVKPQAKTAPPPPVKGSAPAKTDIDDDIPFAPEWR